VIEKAARDTTSVPILETVVPLPPYISIGASVSPAKDAGTDVCAAR
jgi:hypothetical protein